MKRNPQHATRSRRPKISSTPSKKRRAITAGAAVLLLLGIGSLWMMRRTHSHEGAGKVDGRVEGPQAAATATASVSKPDQTLREKREHESELADQINRANQLLASNKVDDAVQLLKTAAQSSPKDEDVHYNLGIALARQGRDEDAIAEYQEALRLFPGYAEAHNNLGNLLLRVGRTAEALQHFEQAVRIAPDFASAWNNFGTALREMGRTNIALGYFQEAVRSDSNYWQARFNLGSSYAELGKPAEAKAEFEAVARLHPGFAPAESALQQIEAAEGARTASP